MVFNFGLGFEHFPIIFSLGLSMTKMLPRTPDFLDKGCSLKEQMYLITLKKKSVIYTAYKTHTSLLELMKNWSDLVRSRWNNDCYFSSYKLNASGITILFAKYFEYKVHNSIHLPKVLSGHLKITMYLSY